MREGNVEDSGAPEGVRPALGVGHAGEVGGGGGAENALTVGADAAQEEGSAQPERSRRLYTSQMPLTPLVLTSIAHSYVGHEQPTGKPTPWVTSMLRAAGEPEDGPWGVAFVTYVGHASHMGPGMTRSTWPLPRVGDADVLARFAEARGVLCREPEVADVALFWSDAEQRYAGAGIVVGTAPLGEKGEGRYRVTTIEGNITNRGTAGGRGIYQTDRVIDRGSRIRFVRWVLLDARAGFGNPVAA